MSAPKDADFLHLMQDLKLENNHEKIHDYYQKKIKKLYQELIKYKYQHKQRETADLVQLKELQRPQQFSNKKIATRALMMQDKLQY